MVENESSPHNPTSPEAEPTRIQPVIDQLKQIPLTDELRKKLEATATDSIAGIGIVKLTEFKSTQVEDRDYEYYIARVEPGKAVNAHFHPRKGELEGQEVVSGPDEEPYFFYSGGEMNTADYSNEQVSAWQRREVQPGEVVNIQADKVHCLNNTNEEPLIFAFACPPDHLENFSSDHPEGNRVMTGMVNPETGVMAPLIPNGVPPHFSEPKD